MNVDLLKIRLLFDSEFTTKEIAEASRLAYTTVTDLRKGVNDLEKASFRTLENLTHAYHVIHNDSDTIKDRSLDEIRSSIETAIKLNEIDGLAIDEATIKQFEAYAEGAISKSELDEFIKNRNRTFQG
ncbi:antitoxin VbhA family protein [Staphylococcus coagulans]|uniref:antitoxin VbhA family protein n=1 Tax=Staphylococcus coagulans TaxID=74706 RepID=UPI001F4C1584|nr:antitoxin VbhA family protein [Staphylococcus coagulans]UNB46772.1 antitoxin VbhA family protein [Staphylococcus coagulans]